ncbi:MAG: hypothetical protein ACLFUW_07880 [Bacteroidales bacterium]
MRKLILVAIVFSLTTCEHLDEMTEFDLDYETSFTIPGTLAIDTPFSISTPEIETNTSQEFSQNNTSADLIEEITLTGLNMTISSPQDSDFSFLNDIEVYLGADGMNDTLIASRNSIPDDVGSTLELQTTSVDLKEYLLKDSFQVKVTVTTDETINQDHEIDLYTKFIVDAEIL